MNDHLATPIDPSLLYATLLRRLPANDVASHSLRGHLLKLVGRHES